MSFKERLVMCLNCLRTFPTTKPKHFITYQKRIKKKNSLMPRHFALIRFASNSSMIFNTLLHSSVEPVNHFCNFWGCFIICKLWKILKIFFIFANSALQTLRNLLIHFTDENSRQIFTGVCLRPNFVIIQQIYFLYTIIISFYIN